MSEPTLVILAAGMGSRFGGLKQITPVDPYGHAIIDFSLFDARRAGFRKVVFIIKHEIEEDFKAAVGRRMEKYFDVSYVFQQLDKLPDGYAVPAGRVKPWGTGHAVLCAKDAIPGPFAVINADDFYGQSAYQVVYDFLTAEGAPNEHAMIGYRFATPSPSTAPSRAASARWKTGCSPEWSSARRSKRTVRTPPSPRTTARAGRHFRAKAWCP